MRSRATDKAFYVNLDTLEVKEKGGLNFRMPPWLLFSLLSAILIAIALIKIDNFAYRARVQALKRENRQLVKLMEDLKSRLQEAEQQVQQLSLRDDALRSYAALPELDESVRSLGVGGSLEKVNENFKEIVPHGDDLLENLNIELQTLSRSLNLQRISYEQIYSKLNKDVDRLRRLPSIPPVRTGFLVSGFGMRPDPFTGEPRFHYGQDFAVLTGTPVYATADGVVVVENGRTGYGKTIVINHSYGYKTLYAHLSQYVVKIGDRVKRGQLIAYSGNTGRSTGPHLHYEVRVNNIPVNPRNYFYTNRLEL